VSIEPARSARPRLAAPERRAALLDCGLRVFSQGSYRGTTTAEIAREAGVTEPILYRHFASKRALYLAVLEESWSRLRAYWERAVEEEPDPRFWVSAMGRAYFAAEDPKVQCAELWVQALTEASDDAEIRKFLRKQMRDVHSFVRDVIERSQAAGGVKPDRDPSAEAWIFISIGLLGTVSRRVGVLAEDDYESIFASRRKWMTGA
jgi:TetR/AcrR family transcriptional regulator